MPKKRPREYWLTDGSQNQTWTFSEVPNFWTPIYTSSLYSAHCIYPSKKLKVALGLSLFIAVNHLHAGEPSLSDETMHACCSTAVTSRRLIRGCHVTSPGSSVVGGDDRRICQRSICRSAPQRRGRQHIRGARVTFDAGAAQCTRCVTNRR